MYVIPPDWPSFVYNLVLLDAKYFQPSSKFNDIDV